MLQTTSFCLKGSPPYLVVGGRAGLITFEIAEAGLDQVMFQGAGGRVGPNHN